MWENFNYQFTIPSRSICEPNNLTSIVESGSCEFTNRLKIGCIWAGKHISSKKWNLHMSIRVNKRANNEFSVIYGLYPYQFVDGTYYLVLPTLHPGVLSKNGTDASSYIRTFQKSKVEKSPDDFEMVCFDITNSSSTYGQLEVVSTVDPLSIRTLHIRGVERTAISLATFGTFTNSKKFFKKSTAHHRSVLKGLFFWYDRLSAKETTEQIATCKLIPGKKWSLIVLNRFQNDGSVIIQGLPDHSVCVEREWHNLLKKVPQEVMRSYLDEISITIQDISIDNDLVTNRFITSFFTVVDDIGRGLYLKMEYYENFGVPYGTTIGEKFNEQIVEIMEKHDNVIKVLNRFHNLDPEDTLLSDRVKRKHRVINVLVERNANHNYYHQRKAVVDSIMTTEKNQNITQKSGGTLTRGTVNQRILQPDRLLCITSHKIHHNMTLCPQKGTILNANDNYNYQGFVDGIEGTFNDCMDGFFVVIPFDKRFDPSITWENSLYKFDKRNKSDFLTLLLDDSDFNVVYGQTFMKLWGCSNFIKYRGVTEALKTTPSIFSTKGNIILPIRYGHSAKAIEYAPFTCSFYYKLEESTAYACHEFARFNGGDNEFSVHNGRFMGNFLFCCDKTDEEFSNHGMNFTRDYSFDRCYSFISTRLFLPEWKHMTKNIQFGSYPGKKGGVYTACCIRKMTASFYEEILFELIGMCYVPPNKKLWSWSDFQYVCDTLLYCYQVYGLPIIEKYLEQEGIDPKEFNLFLYDEEKEDGWTVKYGMLKWWRIYFESIVTFEGNIEFILRAMSTYSNDFEKLEKDVFMFISELTRICYVKDCDPSFRSLTALHQLLKFLEKHHYQTYKLAVSMIPWGQTIQVEAPHQKLDYIMKKKFNVKGKMDEKIRVMTAIGALTEANEMIDAVNELKTKRKFEREEIKETHVRFNKVKKVFLKKLKSILSNKSDCFVSRDHPYAIEIPDENGRDLEYPNLMYYFGENFVDLPFMQASIDTYYKVGKKWEADHWQWSKFFFDFRAQQIIQNTCWPMTGTSIKLRKQPFPYVDAISSICSGWEGRDISYCVRKLRYKLPPNPDFQNVGAVEMIKKDLKPYYSNGKFKKDIALGIAIKVNIILFTHFTRIQIYNFKFNNSPTRKRNMKFIELEDFVPPPGEASDYKDLKNEEDQPRKKRKFNRNAKKTVDYTETQ